MRSKPAVALTMNVHEPDERLVSLAETQLPMLADCHAAMAAFCSHETHPAILALLRHFGVLVAMDAKASAGMSHMGGVRRGALRVGLQASTSHLLFCDFDRALHWASTFPEELVDVITDIPLYDLLILGRTERAWQTYPPFQGETERLFNRVFALQTDHEWDIGAGARGVSRPAAESLLQLSEEPTVGADAEWPLILLREGGYLLGYRPCEGLEFETADRFKQEIEMAGGYQSWESQMNADTQAVGFSSGSGFDGDRGRCPL